MKEKEKEGGQDGEEGGQIKRSRGGGGRQLGLRGTGEKEREAGWSKWFVYFGASGDTTGHTHTRWKEQ